jgi:hypothetical protein
MLARDESLLPKGAAKESYVAIRPSPIKDFARNAWMAVTGREPFTGHIETWDIIGQADLVHEFGMMRVEHGFQVSPAVWEILRPLAQWPYFRSVEFDIGN